MSNPMNRASSVISSSALSNTHPIAPRDVHFSRRAPMPPASAMPSIERSASSERCSRGSRITAAIPSSIMRSSCTVIGRLSARTSWRTHSDSQARSSAVFSSAFKGAKPVGLPFSSVR